MKDELPEVPKASTKVEDGKLPDEAGGKEEQAEGKPDVKPPLPESGAPSEGNVSTAAAAALASAAVKAKVDTATVAFLQIPLALSLAPGQC
jgi:hypothetical protein